MLGHLAAASHVYRLQLADVRPWVERLSEDYGPAAVLVQSLAVADGQGQLLLGTVRHIEQTTMSILRSLRT